jgi:hypothetical protein
MPVSLERLIAEVEPNVITEVLTRECIQVGAIVSAQRMLPAVRAPRCQAAAWGPTICVRSAETVLRDMTAFWEGTL